MKRKDGKPKARTGGRAKGVCGFGPNAPHKSIQFPRAANFTVAEVLTYLPASLHCPGVVARLAAHGAKPEVIAYGVKKYRSMPETAKRFENSICILVCNTMRNNGYDSKWTLSKHKKLEQDAGRHLPTGCDLTTTGFNSPHNLDVSSPSVSSVSILMRSLAVDITEPLGYDALDLTRVIKYAVDHPDQRYMFPEHYHDILQTLGGSKTVQKPHWDKEAFDRWVTELKAGMRSARQVKKAKIQCDRTHSASESSSKHQSSAQRDRNDDQERMMTTSGSLGDGSSLKLDNATASNDDDSSTSPFHKDASMRMNIPEALTNASNKTPLSLFPMRGMPDVIFSPDLGRQSKKRKRDEEVHSSQTPIWRTSCGVPHAQLLANIHNGNKRATSSGSFLGEIQMTSDSAASTPVIDIGQASTSKRIRISGSSRLGDLYYSTSNENYLSQTPITGINQLYEPSTMMQDPPFPLFTFCGVVSHHDDSVVSVQQLLKTNNSIDTTQDNPAPMAKSFTPPANIQTAINSMYLPESTLRFADRSELQPLSFAAPYDDPALACVAPQFLTASSTTSIVKFAHNCDFTTFTSKVNPNVYSSLDSTLTNDDDAYEWLQEVNAEIHSTLFPNDQ
jgi:hypothetical protein